MRKAILLLLIFPLILVAQDRVNRSMPKLSIPISTISKATGWYYNDTDGQWIEHNRNIANLDDFKKIEFRQFDYNGIGYLVLLKYNDTGYFEYPSISRGWVDYVKITYYLISKEEYLSQLVNTDSSVILKFDILRKGSIAESSTSIKDISVDFMRYFESVNESNTNLESEEKIHLDKLVFQYKNYIDKKITRFFIFEEEYKYNKYSLSGFTGSYFTVKDEFKDLLTDKMYELYYYETTLLHFTNFINLKK